MTKFFLTVTEIRSVPCTYMIEAETLDDALTKASNGETDEAKEQDSGYVLDRVVEPEPLSIEEPPPHVCDINQRRALFDARGIYCCYVCDACEADKRDRFRAEIFTDPNYDTGGDTVEAE